jgi:hypothetical protein
MQNVEKLDFKSYISYFTDYVERNWKTGDEFDIITMLGQGTFKLIERTPTRLTWECCDILVLWDKNEDGWRWNHIAMDKKAIVGITFV